MLNTLMQTHKIIQFDTLENGIPKRFDVEGQGILLCRVDDSVHVVQDMCTHEDVSLSLGVLCEHRLRCPLHGSEFDIRTGQVLDEPADENLKTYPSRVENNWVLVDV